MIAWIELSGGFVLLLVGGEMLVRGAAVTARRLGISPLFVGLTVVACGTSAPELVVSLIAALEGAPGIAVGNIVGSNIANLLLILGAAAVICPIAYHPRSLRRDGTVLVVATILFVLLARTGTLLPWHGVLMLTGLVLYLVYSWITDRQDQKAAAEIIRGVEEMGAPDAPAWRTWGMLALGIAGVIAGSELLIDGGVVIARQIGISETVIGLTVIAIGTSLPELATSIIAARHRHVDIALGNAIGSNIFNILWVAGVVSTVTPIPVPARLIAFDFQVLIGVTVGFIAVAFLARRIGRLLGVVFLLTYAGWVTLQFTGLIPVAAAG